MPDVLFRVHFGDNYKIDVQAPNAAEARKIAEKRSHFKITKIKLDRKSVV